MCSNHVFNFKIGKFTSLSRSFPSQIVEFAAWPSIFFSLSLSIFNLVFGSVTDLESVPHSHIGEIHYFSELEFVSDCPI